MVDGRILVEQLVSYRCALRIARKISELGFCVGVSQCMGRVGNKWIITVAEDGWCGYLRILPWKDGQTDLQVLKMPLNKNNPIYADEAQVVYTFRLDDLIRAGYTGVKRSFCPA